MIRFALCAVLSVDGAVNVHAYDHVDVDLDRRSVDGIGNLDVVAPG